jgi:gluconokinase
MTKAIALMGVSGCGKTAVGTHLSDILGWPFFDGDDFHPEGNILKMSEGIPLTDEDRASWLASLQDLIAEHQRAHKPMLLGCSALKQKYRDQLREGNPGVVFVYLKGSYDMIFSRMENRASHYMKADMLRSQFDALEEPVNALVVNIDQSVEVIAGQILRELNLNGTREIK